MAYETKVILIAIAQHAVTVDSEAMYRYVAALANAEGAVLKSWEEAKAEHIGGGKW
ncbi:MAG: hypothetical protein LBI44_07545 [Oscillospiraceae bacterium]|jgi:hypothetical protein|nr:hypothetical protein [Oscillospiraceae bacterium]